MELASNLSDVIVLTKHISIAPLQTPRFLAGNIVFTGKTDSKGDSKVGRFGGGVLIATKGCIKTSPRDDLAYDPELLFIDVITTNNRKITMGVFYLPPNSNLKVLQDLQNSHFRYNINRRF